MNQYTLWFARVSLVALRSSALIVVSVLAVGCGPSTGGLVVEVREAGTRAPVVGAGVEADSYALGMSLKLGDVVDQAMGKRDAVMSRGITDGRGRAELKWVSGRAVQVVILAPGQGVGAPAYVMFNRDLDAGATGWRAAETSEHGPALEVRGEPR